MNRLKLVIFLLIFVALGIVFVQNREPLAIKLLCPNTAEVCLYQTSEFPLAMWMALFTIGGIITSFLSQILNRYAYTSAGRPRYSADDYQEERNKWSMRNNPSEQYRTDSEQIRDSKIQDRYDSTSYEIPQKPESVERSGSTYSYKYRDASNEPKDKINSQENNGQTSFRPSDTDSSINLDKDDEDWI